MKLELKNPTEEEVLNLINWLYQNIDVPRQPIIGPAEPILFNENESYHCGPENDTHIWTRNWRIHCYNSTAFVWVDGRKLKGNFLLEFLLKYR